MYNTYATQSFSPHLHLLWKVCHVMEETKSSHLYCSCLSSHQLRINLHAHHRSSIPGVITNRNAGENLIIWTPYDLILWSTKWTDIHGHHFLAEEWSISTLERSVLRFALGAIANIWSTNRAVGITGMHGSETWVQCSLYYNRYIPHSIYASQRSLTCSPDGKMSPTLGRRSHLADLPTGISFILHTLVQRSSRFLSIHTPLSPWSRQNLITFFGRTIHSDTYCDRVSSTGQNTQHTNSGPEARLSYLTRLGA